MPEIEGQAPNTEGQAAGAANAQGETKPVSQEIDYSKIDASKLPESVIKEHPAYKGLLSESIERRQQIKGLREQLKALEGGEKPSAKPEIGANKPAQDADIPEWGKKILETMSSVLDTNAQNQRKEMVSKALKKHNLPDGAAQYVQGSTEAEIEASAAGLVPLVAANVGSAGNAGGGSGSVHGTRQRIKDLVRGKSDSISTQSPLYH